MHILGEKDMPNNQVKPGLTEVQKQYYRECGVSEEEIQGYKTLTVEEQLENLRNSTTPFEPVEEVTDLTDIDFGSLSWLNQKRVIANSKMTHLDKTKDPEKWASVSVSGTLTDDHLRNVLGLSDNVDKDSYFNQWTDTSNKVFPIRVGDKVVGEVTGELGEEDVTVKIWHQDFSFVLSQQPMESGPNANDRSLQWAGAKDRAMNDKFFKTNNTLTFDCTPNIKD